VVKLVAKLKIISFAARPSPTTAPPTRLGVAGILKHLWLKTEPQLCGGWRFRIGWA